MVICKTNKVFRLCSFFTGTDTLFGTVSARQYFTLVDSITFGVKKSCRERDIGRDIKARKRYESLAALPLMFNILKITASLQKHHRLSFLGLSRTDNAPATFIVRVRLPRRSSTLSFRLSVHPPKLHQKQQDPPQRASLQQQEFPPRQVPPLQPEFPPQQVPPPRESQPPLQVALLQPVQPLYPEQSQLQVPPL